LPLPHGQSSLRPILRRAAAAAATTHDLPLSLHTATRRQGRIRGASIRLSLCDMIFSGVFERHLRLTLAIVEIELAWAPHLLSAMDYTFRERHGEAIYRFKACPREGGGRHAPERLLPSQRRPELPGGAIGIRLPPPFPPPLAGEGQGGGVDNMMWGLGLSAQRVDVSPIAQDPGGDPRGRAG
jgi:hypothetical protein